MTGSPQVAANKRSADARDFEIGRRIRAVRLERGLSQTELGNLIGVTFQQVQKYEKGANRMASGRLHRLCEALGASITFFYADGPAAGQHGDTDSVDVGLEFLETAGAVRLVRAFSRIKDPDMRRALMEIVEGVAGREQNR